MTYVPYCETAPQTTDLRELKLELDRVRALHGPGSSQGAEAYNRLSREAGKQGRPLDGLRRFSKDETERFFAQVVTGPDGHAYWDGSPHGYTRNDGKHRAPARWWWGHLHGEITSPTLRLHTTCGDTKCINPEHLKIEHFVPRRFNDDQMLGALQVAAMRLGKTPTATEWDASGAQPTATVYRQRFGGTWENVCRAAGLKHEGRSLTPVTAVRSLQLAKEFLGRWPSSWDYTTNQSLQEALKARHVTVSRTAIARQFGSWENALKQAGKR